MQLGSKKTTGIFFLIALFIAGCQSEQAPPQSPQQPAPAVSVAQVISQNITEWDEFTGRLQAPANVELRPRVSGYVEKVSFVEGSLVKAGDVLLQIDDRAFKAAVAGLQAQLTSGKTQLALAKSEYQRAQQLAAKNAISNEVLDSRLAQQQRAAAAVQATLADLENARLNVSHAQVVAPIDGRISRAFATKGNFVSAGQTVLTSIVSTGEMYAYFSADERSYLNYVNYVNSANNSSETTEGDDKSTSSADAKRLVYMALMTDADYPYTGHIDFVDNQIDPSTGTILGRAVFDNSDGTLIPGLFTRLRLAGSAAYDAILIDDKAVGTDLNKKFVLVLDDNNIVQYRPVVLGEKVAGLRIVHSGLTANEKIVVQGLQRVRPGSPVTPELVPMADEKALGELDRTFNDVAEQTSTPIVLAADSAAQKEQVK